MCVAGGKKPTERIALETVFGCVRAGAARFLRQGVVPRYRGIASVHYYMLANCAPAKCCVRPVAAPAGVFVRAGAGLRGGVALSRCFAFGARLLYGSLAAFCVRGSPALRLSRGVLCSGHACCLPHERQTGRLAICFVPIPPWVEIASSAFSSVDTVIWLGWFTSGLGVFLWRSRRGNGVGGAA